MSLVSFSLAGFVAMNFVGRSALLAQDICDVPWRLEETLRIGSLDGDDALSGVLDLEIGPDGEIYVAQQFVPRVTVFTAEGRLDRTIGRAGSGPGEFDMGPTRLGWFGDMLWVSDLSVTHFFRSDGTEARQVAFAAPMYEEGSRFMPGRPLADGSFLGNRHVVFRRGYGSFFEMEQLTVPRFSDKGAVVDTIMT